MFRRTCRFAASVDPQLSKYYTATFADGAHRVAPDPQHKAWMDRKSPVSRFWGWYAQPVAKGSVVAAWCLTAIASYYCACVADDARATYMVNTALQRHLHLEGMKSQESNLRLQQVQKSIEADVARNPDQAAPAESVVNYELELVRERARSKLVHDRNSSLVAELQDIRGQLRQVERDRETLRDEVDKLNKYVRQLSE